MLATIGICIGCLILVYALIDLSWRLWTRKLSHVQCPFQVPWLGSAPYLEMAPNKLFEQVNHLTKLLNGTILIWVGWRPVIFSSRKEVVEDLLRSTEMITKSYNYDYFHDWLGTGLLTSTGSKWRKRRKAITPTFHFSILNDFVDIFVKHSDVLVEKVKALANKGSSVDVQNIISHAALDVICDTAMGVCVDAQSQESEYVNSIHFVNSQLMYRMRTPWLWPSFIFRMTTNGRKYYQKLKILQEFTTDVINKKIKERNEKSEKPFEKKKKQAFMDMLLDLYDQGEIDIDGIREEVDTFMFEGHDTTASCMSWTLYELGKNPEVQRKLQEEIDAAENSDGIIMEKITATKYLEYVIKEGLRVHPPVSLFGREIEKEENIGGIIVPKGTTIAVQCYGLQRSEEYWTNPDEFKPERFADDTKRHPFIFVPFSAGSRNCIGQKFAMMEMKVVLYKLMKHFNIESLTNDQELECTFDVIHKSINGLNVRFTPREQ